MVKAPRLKKTVSCSMGSAGSNSGTAGSNCLYIDMLNGTLGPLMFLLFICELLLAPFHLLLAPTKGLTRFFILKLSFPQNHDSVG